MTTATYETVRIDLVIPDEAQPRKTSGLEDESIESMVESVKGIGIIHDIVVTRHEDGKYRIVVGERRYRAALKAGLTELRVKVVDLDEEGRLEYQLIEDSCRRNIDVRDRASAIKRFVDSQQDQKTAAKRLGITPARLSQLLELTQLQPTVVQLLEANMTKDTSTLVIANKLAKEHPEKLAAIVESAAANGGKLTRRELQEAAAPYSKRKKKEGDVQPSGSPGSTGTSANELRPDSTEQMNLERTVDGINQLPHAAQIAFPGFERVEQAKLARVRRILQLRADTSGPELIERLIEELLKREDQTS